MRLPLRVVPAALAVAAFLAAVASPATGREGLLSRSALFRTVHAPLTSTDGGVTAWIRLRSDGTIQQHFSAWAQGLYVPDVGGNLSADLASLWMAAPGEDVLEQVAEMPVYGGTARFQVGVDSNREINDELPLGVDSVVRLLRAPVEIRVATDVDDLPYLEGEIAVFRFRSIASGEGRRGVSTRKARLRRPRNPSDDTFGDEAARGYVRLWRDRSTGTGSGEGITLFVQGLTPEAEYEVWVEDDFGDLVDVTDEIGVPVVTTADGQGLFVVNTRPEGADDTLPDIGADSVRDLRGRRVEVRQSGAEDYSLVGIFPRVR